MNSDAISSRVDAILAYRWVRCSHGCDDPRTGECRRSQHDAKCDCDCHRPYEIEEIRRASDSDWKIMGDELNRQEHEPDTLRLVPTRPLRAPLYGSPGVCLRRGVCVACKTIRYVHVGAFSLECSCGAMVSMKNARPRPPIVVSARWYEAVAELLAKRREVE